MAAALCVLFVQPSDTSSVFFWLGVVHKSGYLGRIPNSSEVSKHTPSPPPPPPTLDGIGNSPSPGQPTLE